MKFNKHFIIALVLFAAYLLPAQHGAYIAPVMKFTKLNGQSALIFGAKGGWVINNTFVIGGAFFGHNTDVKQSWVDPLAGSAPYIKFNCGGVNFEYIFYRYNNISFSAEIFMGGAGLTFQPVDESKPSTKIYGGDFLIWEPQLNITYDMNQWFHLSLGLNYRTTSGLEMYPDNPANAPGNADFPLKELRGASAVISFIFGMY